MCDNQRADNEADAAMELVHPIVPECALDELDPADEHELEENQALHAQSREATDRHQPVAGGREQASGIRPPEGGDGDDIRKQKQPEQDSTKCWVAMHWVCCSAECRQLSHPGQGSRTALQAAGPHAALRNDLTAVAALEAIRSVPFVIKRILRAGQEKRAEPTFLEIGTEQAILRQYTFAEGTVRFRPLLHPDELCRRANTS